MFEDPLSWARLQFALTASTHYLFVALTLGLAPLILAGQIRATLLRDEARMRAIRFWGGLYVINYGMGILSGLVMELQLAVNWGGLNHAFGNVFSAPLAVETLVAFFIESTFLALWVFGWDRMNRWAHLAAFAVVTATAYASAYWVLVANGFLKNPVGFELVDGVAVLTDTSALLTNPSTTLAFWHIAAAALLVGGLFTAAVSAYHLRRGQDPDGMFRRGIRLGTVVTALALFPTAVFGGVQFELIFRESPPTSGDTLSQARIERIEEAAGSHFLDDIVRELMMFLWLLILLLTVVVLIMWMIGRLDRARRTQALLVYAPVLPLLASVFGWVAREVGRQPWVVVHHMTTADGLTDMTSGMAMLSFVLFTAAFATLATITYLLLARYARLGPERGPLAPPRDTDHEASDVPRPTY